MSAAPYPSLADFAATWSDTPLGTAAFAHPAGEPLAFLDTIGVRHDVEALLDTVVALQRAEWLQDGVYVGPRSMPDVYRDVLDAARVLRVAVPPAVVSGVTGMSQGAAGTDARAFLYLSSFFLKGAEPAERRFAIGRLCGHIAARHVSAVTLYALLVDQGGLRKLASRALGPALEVLLAPVSLGARVALSRWHRAAEVTADRAGLLCAGDLDAAARAMLRASLGTRPDVSPQEYLDALDAAGADRSPGRYAELLASQPFTHKRIRALELFARSEAWASFGHAPRGGPPLAKAELDAETERLLGVA